LADVSSGGSTVSTCFVAGNRFPDGDADGNAVGQTPSLTVTNSNILGFNVGLTDSISLPASSGVSGFETHLASDGYAGISHWVMKSTNDYWEINRESFSGTRILYFPINGLPNGAKLNSVNVQGNTILGDAEIEARLFKKSVNIPITTTPLTGIVTLPTGEYGNNTPGGTTRIPEPFPAAPLLAEIINYKENSYYVRLTHAEVEPPIGGPTNINIHGITVNFTY